MNLPPSLLRAPKRRQMFEFIVAEVSEGHQFPSPRAIADHMNWKNEASAIQALSYLAHYDHVIEVAARTGRGTTYRLKETPMSFEPAVGDKVMLSAQGESVFKRQIRGKVELIDPNDETAVKVRISEPATEKGNLRTISLRHLRADP